ncbi:hypothetical protein M2263_002349 [Providencia alcalifaciens]|nr:hypothetical protein [Providencia alcalifaciens]
MNKRTLTRAQAWGGIALRENSRAAWNKGMKIIKQEHYRGAYEQNKSSQRALVVQMRQ